MPPNKAVITYLLLAVSGFGNIWFYKQSSVDIAPPLSTPIATPSVTHTIRPFVYTAASRFEYGLPRSSEAPPLPVSSTAVEQAVESKLVESNTSTVLEAEEYPQSKDTSECPARELSISLDDFLKLSADTPAFFILLVFIFGIIATGILNFCCEMLMTLPGCIREFSRRLESYRTMRKDMRSEIANAIQAVIDGQDEAKLYKYTPQRNAEIADLNSTNRLLLEEIYDKDDVIKQCQKTNRTLESKHDRATWHIDRLKYYKNENRTLHASLRQREVINSALSRKISDLGRASIDKSISHITELNEKQEEVEALSIRLDNTMNKLQSAEDSKKQTQKAIRSRHATIEKLEDSLTEASTGWELAKGEIGKLQDSLTEASTGWELAKGEIEDKNGVIKKLKNKLDDKRDIIHDLDGEVEDLKAEIIQLGDELRAKDDKYQKLEGELAKVNADIQNLSDVHTENVLENDQSERRLKDQIATLEDQLRAAKNSQHASTDVQSTAATPSNDNGSSAVDKNENGHTIDNATTSTPTSAEVPVPVGQAAPKAAVPPAAPPSNGGSTKTLNKAESSHDDNNTKPPSSESGNMPSRIGQVAPKPVTSSTATPSKASSSNTGNKVERSHIDESTTPPTTVSGNKPSRTDQQTLAPVTFGEGTIRGQNSTGFNFDLGGGQKQISCDLTDWDMSKASSSVNSFNIQAIQKPPGLAASQHAPTNEEKGGGSIASRSSSETNNTLANEQATTSASQGSSSSLSSAEQQGLMASQHAPTAVNNAGVPTVSQNSTATNNTPTNGQAPATTPHLSQSNAAASDTQSRNMGIPRRNTRGGGKKVNRK